MLVVMVTPDLVKRKLHAGRIAGEAAKAMGGGGGGRPEMAQAGGRDKGNLGKALNMVPELVRKAIS
jgi:alanyl-tRNA synthetase